MRMLQFASGVFLILSCGTIVPVRAQQNRSLPASKTTRQLPGDSPDILGFSTERLRRLKSALEQSVQDRQFAGMIYVLARHGKVVQSEVFGKKDLAAGTPMTGDTIFRIASMTKPITAVAEFDLRFGPTIPYRQLAEHRMAQQGV